jgi:hypothetical protein
MSELEVGNSAQKGTEPLAGPEHMPWRSLFWFTLLLGTGCLLHGPLQVLRELIAMRYLGRVNRWIDFLSEFPAAICVMGLMVHVTLASICVTWTVGKLWQRTLVFVVNLL